MVIKTWTFSLKLHYLYIKFNESKYKNWTNIYGIMLDQIQIWHARVFARILNFYCSD